MRLEARAVRDITGLVGQPGEDRSWAAGGPFTEGVRDGPGPWQLRGRNFRARRGNCGTACAQPPVVGSTGFVMSPRPVVAKRSFGLMPGLPGRLSSSDGAQGPDLRPPPQTNFSPFLALSNNSAGGSKRSPYAAANSWARSVKASMPIRPSGAS